MRFLYFGTLVASTLLSSCDSSTPQPTLPTATVTGRIQMIALENQSSLDPKLVLSFRDEGRYHCANYMLNTQYKQQGKQLRFVFTNVTAPDDICLAAIGPATSTVDISALPAGKYTLNIQVGTRHTTGVLELQENLIRLSSNQPNIVAAPTPELRFQPKNIVWGYATTMLPPTQASVETLRDSLQRLGATPTTLPPGAYSQFTIAANGLPEPPQVSAGTRSLLLLVRYTGPAERIQAFVRRANAATPGLNLWLNSSGI